MKTATYTIPDLIARFGIEDGGVLPNGARAMRITRNVREATKIQAEIIGQKAEILGELDRRRDEARARVDAEKAAYAARMQALQSGAPFALHWQPGDPLSGWTAFGADADLLCRLGVAHDVAGWGVLVDEPVISACGEAPTLTAIEAYLAPARAEAAEKATAQAEAEASALAQAAATGSPVLLRKTPVPCDGSELECSVDVILTEALPTGEIFRRRVHTY